MRTSDRGIVALMGHEGIVPAPYRDSVGVWTFGVGHTASAGAPDPAKLPRGMPANIDAALVNVFDVFRRDLARYESAVSRAFKVQVSQQEFDAAVSFHFNTGAIGRASWVKSLNAGNREQAAREMMNWCKPVEIIPRRQAEQRLFRDGVYPAGPVHIWNVDGAGRVRFRPVRSLTPGEALHLLRGARPQEVPADPADPAPRPAGTIAAVGAGVAATIAALVAFACKIPLLSSLFSNCGG